MTKNFSRSEFACSCCGKDDISLELVQLLQGIRDLYGPIRITSGVRCAVHNKKIGGVKNSAHVKGLAVDIQCATSAARYELLPLVFSRFTRIGIGASFLHLDIDASLPQDVIFTYYGVSHQA